MGRTIRDIIEDSGGHKCIVRRDGWSVWDYAVVHRVSGTGSESEAFGFTNHKGNKVEAGSIKRAWTETWNLVRVLPDRVDYGGYRDKTSRLLRAAYVIEANGIGSWKEFRAYLDENRDDDTGLLELYGCMKDKQHRQVLSRYMDGARAMAGVGA